MLSALKLSQRESQEFQVGDACEHSAADTEHVFEGRENDWGFNSFAPLHELLNTERGFLHNGALHLKVLIEVEHPDNYLYNSKKKTGFVGLKNQGATCYLNSLLQTLYNINYFRKVAHQLSQKGVQAHSNALV